MKRNTRNVLVVIGSIVAVLGPPSIISALAQDVPTLLSPRSPLSIINLFDDDKDGRISRSEVRFKSIAVFDQFDANKDGTLATSELPGLSPEVFQSSDTNKNGTLSTFEYSQAEFLQFDVIDADKDNYISASEIAAYQSRKKNR